MPLYRVTWDGQDILDYTDERMVLLSPHHEMEVNTAGSLRFVVPPYHTFYDLFTDETMLISDIEVYEDEELIWFGRPLELHVDFFKQKEIYCEGALAFFNDSVVEQANEMFDSVSIHDFFRRIVENHNYQVDEKRRFIVGNITIDDKTVYRAPKYEKTLDVLRGQCLDTNGGYFFVRKENGKYYIDWLKDMPFTCNQTIKFAENMLNVKRSFDGADYATCIMPLGADDGTGYPINVMDVNGGEMIIASNMAQIYGRIVTVMQFNDIEDKTELLEEGRKALERIQYNSRSIECSAADLHSVDGSKEKFKVGQMVHCLSQPHGLEMDLPLSKMDLYLDTAAKHITLGIIKKRTLTRIRKDKQTEQSSYEPSTPGSIDATFTDEDGIEWEIHMPDENGGDVTASRMPTHITILRDPNKTQYEPGEQLDFTGLIVQIWAGDKVWTYPPSYIDGTAPMSELSFSTKTAPNVSEFSVQVIWKYKGKSFSTLLELTTANEQRRKTSPLINGYIQYAPSPLDKSQNDYTHHNIYGGGQYIVILNFPSAGENRITVIIVSNSPGKAFSYETWSDGSMHNKIEYELHSFTYDDKTVYCTSINIDYNPELASINAPVNYDISKVSGMPGVLTEACAWTVLYGS